MWYTRQQYRDCVMGRGVSVGSLAMLHVSHPYLVFLSFYIIPICLFFNRIFNLLVTILNIETALGHTVWYWPIKCDN